MQEYPVKRTHIKVLPENITAKITEHFGTAPVEKDGYTISFGALESMQVKLGDAKISNHRHCFKAGNRR